MNQEDAIERILSSLGVERRRTLTDYLLPAAGLVATGMLVGAGLGLMFAPKQGAELRDGLRRKVAGLVPRRSSGRNGEKPLEDMSRQELYELARRHTGMQQSDPGDEPAQAHPH